MEIIPLQQNRKTVSLIVKYLQEGKVLVFPTDTVYGLVCDAGNEEAVNKIFDIKKREKAKPLAVFVKDIKMAVKYAYVGGEQREFLKENWPGAVTVILKGKKGLAKLVHKDGTIGLRQPDYEIIIKILKEFKKPLAQTSANISGQPATTKIKEVLEQFENADIQPDVIIDAGDLSENKPSKVVDFTTNKINSIRR